MNSLFTFARETSLGRALIPIGMILIIFGIISLNITRNTGNYIQTDAVVSRADLVPADQDDDADQKDHYDIYVKYTVEGTDYEEYFGELSDCKEGDKIRISYNPDAPEQITQPGSNAFTSLLFIAAGVAAMAGGIISLIRAMQKHRRMKAQEEEWANG